MAYAIFGIKKVKSLRSTTGSGKHVDRKQKTPNANPELYAQNLELIETNGKDLSELVTDRIGDAWRRKDAVLCVDMRLAASPEYFRPDDPEEYGAYIPENLDQWKQKNIDWLKDEFGDRIVKATLHLDEATPHIHAFMVPVQPDPKNPGKEKLNCKSFFGGTKHVMREWATKYADAMGPLGLERGTEGKIIRHQTMKERYRKIGKVGDIEKREKAVTEKEATLRADREKLSTQQLEYWNDYGDLRREKSDLERKAAELKRLQAEMAAQIEQQKRQQQELERRNNELETQQRAIQARAIASCLLDRTRKKAKLPQPYRIETIRGKSEDDENQTILWAGEREVLVITKQGVTPGTDIQQKDVETFQQWHQQLEGVQVRSKVKNQSPQTAR